MARTLVSGFLSIIGARVVTVLITFLTTPIVVRLLGGPGAYGNYKFLMSGFALLMIFVSSGLTDGIQKFVAESSRFEHWEDHVVGFYVRTAVGLAFAGAAVVLFAAQMPAITRAFGERFEFYLLILAVLVFTAQFRTLVQRALRGMGKERYSEPLRILDTGVWAVGSVGLLWLGFGVAAVLVAHILGSLLVTVVGFALIAREVSLSKTFSPTPAQFPTREILSFNVLSVVLILFMTSLYKVDIIMVRTFLTDELTGEYAAALALAEHLWVVPMAIQGMFIHSASKLWSERKLRTIDRMASKTTRYTLMLSALLAMGVAVLAEQFIPLYYGPGFENAVLPLLLLLPGTIAFAVIRPSYAIGQGSGTLKPIVLATGVAAVVNVALNFLLIPRFGIVGAAIATSVGYAVMLPLHLWSAYEIGFDPLKDLRPGRVFVATIVAGIPIFALSRAITGPLVFLVVPVGGLLLYGLAAIVTRAVTVSELLDLGAAVPGPIGGLSRSARDRFEDDSGGTPFSHILTVLGILLFATGIVLSMTGTLVPGAGPEDLDPTGGTENATTTTQMTTQTPTPTSTAGPTATSTTEPTTSTATSTTTTEDPFATSTSTTDSTSTTSTTEEPFGTTTTSDTTTTTSDTTTTTSDTTTSTTDTTTETTTTTTETTTTTTTTSTTTTSTTSTTSTTTTTSDSTSDTTTTTSDTTTTTTTTEDDGILSLSGWTAQVFPW